MVLKIFGNFRSNFPFFFLLQFFKKGKVPDCWVIENWRLEKENEKTGNDYSWYMNAAAPRTKCRTEESPLPNMATMLVN